MADYIKTVEIEGLLGDENSKFKWKLNRNVNILAGANGSGKSTVLQAIYAAITGDTDEKLIKISYLNKENIKLVFHQEGKSFDIAFLQSLESPLPSSQIQQVFANTNSKTQLDLKAAMAENSLRAYLARKANLFNKGQVRTDAQQVFQQYNLFLDLLDKAFAISDKKVDRDYNGFQLINKYGRKLQLNQLSTGEKQLFCLYTHSLTADLFQPLLLLDEPEISLHLDWQETLIDSILALNPNAQLIIATHSPYILGLKWGLPEYVFQMEELITYKSAENEKVS